MWPVRKLVVAVTVLAVLATASPIDAGGPEPGWEPSMRRAIRWGSQRVGLLRVAVVDEAGRLHRHNGSTRVVMASVLKVMLMVAYLRQPSVRHRRLHERDRDLLAPMIRWSDSVTASRILHDVGAAAVRRVARRARMRAFHLVMSPWGLSETSARDQALFMYRLERYIPHRHRRYARRLLASIIGPQRWGIADAVPSGWRIFFKGGWGDGSGRVTHQVAFLESGDRRIALAILTEYNPNHTYGTRTVRGVARRLLRGL